MEKVTQMDQCTESLRETIAEAKNRPMLSSHSSQEMNSINNSTRAQRLRGMSDQDLDTKGHNLKLQNSGLAKSTTLSNSNNFPNSLRLPTNK